MPKHSFKPRRRGQRWSATKSVQILVLRNRSKYLVNYFVGPLAMTPVKKMRQQVQEHAQSLGWAVEDTVFDTLEKRGKQ